MKIEPFEKDSMPYKRLEFVAKGLEIISEHGAKYAVQDVYYDFGENIMWTTIVRVGYRECQILSHKDWIDIRNSNKLCDLANIIERIRLGKYFND